MKHLFSITDNNKLIFVILIFFPLSFVLGNLIINFLLFLSLISFLINIKESKKFFFDKINYFLIFLFITTLINLYFSAYPINSYLRVLKILLIIIFVFEFRRFFQTMSNKNFTFLIRSWSFVFCIVISDVIFEFTFGFNSIGNFTTLEGRISSFFGDELVVGAFFYSFCLIFISHLVTKKVNHTLIGFVIIAMITISFIIGERSNFLRFFSIAIIFYFIILNLNVFKKLTILIILMFCFLGILNFNKEYKYRYIGQIKSLYKMDGFIDYFKQSKYGAHQNAAYQIFTKYPIFGVGIKNFRLESSKKIYENKEYSATDVRQSTHPHQIHLEILSETGIFGYFSFLIFIISTVYFSIKNYLKSKNYYQLSSILYVVSSLYPILPSGSFYSTFSGGLFWFNFALMVSFIKTESK